MIFGMPGFIIAPKNISCEQIRGAVDEGGKLSFHGEEASWVNAPGAGAVPRGGGGTLLSTGIGSQGGELNVFGMQPNAGLGAQSPATGRGRGGTCAVAF